MRIIDLACKRCGAPLKIKDGMDYFACGNCGAQLYVEREGGTVSLQLVEALGSIRTGAAQTAAELALVRLNKELAECNGRINSLEYGAQTCEANFRPNDLLSKRALASAEANVAALRTLTTNLKKEITERTEDEGNVWAVGATASFLGGAVGCHVASGFGPSVGALVAIPFIGLIFTAIVAAYSGPASQQRDLEKGTAELAKLEREVQAHQTALGYQTKLSEIPLLLVDARAEQALIQERITYNRSIVNSR